MASTAVDGSELINSAPLLDQSKKGAGKAFLSIQDSVRLAPRGTSIGPLVLCMRFELYSTVSDRYGRARHRNHKVMVSVRKYFIPLICILKLSTPVPAEVVTIQVYSPAWMRPNEPKRSALVSVTVTPGVLNISPPNNQVTLAGAGVGMPDKKMPTVVPVPKLSDTMTSFSTITLGLPATDRE